MTPWFTHPQAIVGVYDFLISDEYNLSYIKKCPWSFKLYNGSEEWSGFWSKIKCINPSLKVLHMAGLRVSKSRGNFQFWVNYPSNMIQICRVKFTKFELWSKAKCKTSSFEFVFPVSSFCMHMNRCQWNEKSSVITPLVSWMRTQTLNLKGVIWCYFKDHYFVYLV